MPSHGCICTLDLCSWLPYELGCHSWQLHFFSSICSWCWLAAGFWALISGSGAKLLPRVQSLLVATLLFLYLPFSCGGEWWLHLGPRSQDHCSSALPSVHLLLAATFFRISYLQFSSGVKCQSAPEFRPLTSEAVVKYPINCSTGGGHYDFLWQPFLLVAEWCLDSNHWYQDQGSTNCATTALLVASFLRFCHFIMLNSSLWVRGLNLRINT